MSLQGRVAMVTGAGGGVGRELAGVLAQRGASLVLVGRGVEAVAASLEGEAGLRVIACELDLRDDEALRRAVARAVETFGAIDILVNNAGVMYLAPMADAEVEDWQAMVDVNLKAPLALVGAVLPLMVARGSGHILNVSSISARRVGPGVAVYAATKAALDTVTEGLRQELAPRGVRVTGVQLGAVATPLNDKIRNPAMRRLIKTRESAYTPIPPRQAAEAIADALCLPAALNVGSLFLVPADQAG
jgi:NADP-dependent 3-hydroxy acid dehydrogenase YdfG